MTVASIRDLGYAVNLAAADPYSLPALSGNGFDQAFYLDRYPDVAAAGIDLYQHYLTFGWKEGRDPDAFFSTLGYLNDNPDVKAAGLNPLLHYDASGWREGRDPGSQFDTEYYLLHNPDVAAALRSCRQAFAGWHSVRRYIGRSRVFRRHARLCR